VSDEARALLIRRFIGSLFLASGVALVVYILSGISLLATFVAAVAFAIGLGLLAWNRSD